MKKITNFFKNIIKAGITASKARAKNSGLIELPEAMSKGANCLNCHYWKETATKGVGYCNHPRVSMFVSDRQLCNLWNSNGVQTKWGEGEVEGLEEYKNLIPEPGKDITYDLLGGITPLEPKQISRAKDVNLITLPKNIKASACYNCKYSSDMGWCKNSGVAQPIEKDYLCHYWDHPGTIRSKWKGLNEVQEERVKDRTNKEMRDLRNKLRDL